MFDSIEKWRRQRACEPHSDIVRVVYAKKENNTPWIYEVCVRCDYRMGESMPMISDEDVPISSYKYPKKTLGDIYKIDRAYVLWIITKSKASSRIKKAAVRIYYDIPYVVPKEGETYSVSKIYSGRDYNKMIKELDPTYNKT